MELLQVNLDDDSEEARIRNRMNQGATDPRAARERPDHPRQASLHLVIVDELPI